MHPYIGVDTQDGGEKYVGFRINRSELQVWEGYYSFSSITGNSDVGPLKVAASCWVGNSNERPSSSSGRERIVKEVPSSGPLRILAKPPNRAGVEQKRYNCIFGLHQKVNDVSSILFPSGTFAFSENDAGEVVEVSDDSGEAYLAQGAETEGAEMQVATGFTIVPGGSGSTEGEIRSFYQNHYNSGAVTSGDIWPMYPKEGDIPPLANYNYRHPGQFFENEN